MSACVASTTHADMWASIRSLAASGRVLAARAALDSAQQSVDQAGGESCEEQACSADVRRHAACVDAALVELCAPEEGWACALEGELRARYRHQAGSRVHSTWFVGDLPAPLRSVLAIAREFDLVSSWCRFLMDTQVLSATSLLSLSVYAALWVPPPLTDRDFAVRVDGYDCLDEHGCVLVIFRDSDEDLPVVSDSRVRMRFSRACIRLTPLAGGGTRGELIGHIDPAMPGGLDPPEWLVTWALRVLCPFIFAAARRVAASVGVAAQCPYVQRFAGNEELYGLVAQREAAFRATLPPRGITQAPAEAPTQSMYRRLADMLSASPAAA